MKKKRDPSGDWYLTSLMLDRNVINQLPRKLGPLAGIVNELLCQLLDGDRVIKASRAISPPAAEQAQYPGPYAHAHNLLNQILLKVTPGAARGIIAALEQFLAEIDSRRQTPSEPEPKRRPSRTGDK